MNTPTSSPSWPPAARSARADLRGAEISGLNLAQIASFAHLKITQGQQHIILTAMGIDVHPEPD